MEVIYIVEPIISTSSSGSVEQILFQRGGYSFYSESIRYVYKQDED